VRFVGEPSAPLTVTVVENDAPCSMLISAKPAILPSFYLFIVYLVKRGIIGIKNPAEAGSLEKLKII
jgi:hypothetical protein